MPHVVIMRHIAHLAILLIAQKDLSRVQLRHAYVLEVIMMMGYLRYVNFALALVLIVMDPHLKIALLAITLKIELSIVPLENVCVWWAFMIIIIYAMLVITVVLIVPIIQIQAASIVKPQHSEFLIPLTISVYVI